MMHVPDVHEHDIDKAPPASPPPAEVAVRAADAAMPSVRLSYTPDDRTSRCSRDGGDAHAPDGSTP